MRGWVIPALLSMLALAPLLGCSLQHRMLYFPSPDVPSENVVRSCGLRFWPQGPDGYRGLLGTSLVGAGRGTVIVFHGNGGTALHRTYYNLALEPLGYRVLLAEYPRYGGRPGELGEDSFVADARETLSLVARQFGGPVFLLGESLGAGVASAVAKDPPPELRGLVLVTPWDALAPVARHHFPWLPVSWFLRDTYDNRTNLKDFSSPVAVVGAERDEIIPARLTAALYASLPAPKRFWLLDGVGHNDWLAAVGPSCWAEVMRFVSSGGGS